MFFILHFLFFIIYRFYSNFVEIWAPRSNFALKSAYKKLTKNKKNFRPTDPNIFRHVSGNTGIFLGLINVYRKFDQNIHYGLRVRITFNLSKKCNFYIKYFDKIKCYADRPYLVFSELKPETHTYFFSLIKWPRADSNRARVVILEMTRWKHLWSLMMVSCAIQRLWPINADWPRTDTQWDYKVNHLSTRLTFCGSCNTENDTFSI